jgi:hypothetical protein
LEVIKEVGETAAELGISLDCLVGFKCLVSLVLVPGRGDLASQLTELARCETPGVAAFRLLAREAL